MTYFSPSALVNKTDRKQNGKTLSLSQIFKFSSIKSAAENMINCDTCSKTFANKQNLYRHLRNIHDIEMSKSEQRNCMECPFKSYSLAVMQKHIEEKHGTTKPKLCIHCNSLFSDTNIFNKHFKKFIRSLQLHKHKIRNANYLKHLLLLVQCKRTS